MILLKPGVVIGNPAPAGFRILAALEQASDEVGRALTITCGIEKHAPLDPHTLGEAYDVRSKDLLSSMLKEEVLHWILFYCAGHAPDRPVPDDDGLGTKYFWGWIENRGTADEHFHIQRRKGQVYGSMRSRVEA